VGVKRREEKLFGFGHRVYKNFDPRANIIRGLADEVFAIAGRDPLIDVATGKRRAHAPGSPGLSGPAEPQGLSSREWPS
jgi:hypothetical protein